MIKKKEDLWKRFDCSGNQTHTFAYDILDRMIQATSPNGSVNYTYDLVSRLTGFTAPSSGYAPVQYAYDNLDRLTSITQQGKTYGYTYDKLGRRTSLTRPSGVTTTYSYDAASRLTEIRHAKGATVIETQTFVYDASGNLVSRVKTGGLYGNLTYQYGYDKLNRLIKTEATGILSASSFKNKGQEQAALQHVSNAAKLTNPTAKAQQLKNAVKLGALLPENAAWTFDANGNIASKTVFNPDGTTSTRTLTYDAADRLIKITMPGGQIVTLSYDANGNMISDSTGRQMSWNARDQLTHLSTPQLSASFAYDPLGRRTSFNKGAVSRSYFYNGLDMLSDGSARYLHGAGLDEPLEIQPVGSAPAQSYLQDHLGSTTKLLHAETGQATAQYDYTSYGDLEANASNPSLSNPFTYTGREDDGTGLMYYRARYYDPELEVFISQDPLGDAQRYVGGNPMGLVDPSGKQSLISMGTAGLLGGVIALGGWMAYNQATALQNAQQSKSHLTVLPGGKGSGGDPNGFNELGNLIVTAAMIGIYQATHSPDDNAQNHAGMPNTNKAPGPSNLDGKPRSLSNPASLIGATPQEIEDLIPSDWSKGPLRKGEGTRYSSPNGADAVFVEKGWPNAAPGSLHSGPYVKTSINGQTTWTPLRGNPVLK